jgi:hypothetical protein
MYWVTGILGLALMVAPFLLGYTSNVTAFWTSLVAGLIVLAVSLYKAITHDQARWEYMVATVVGLLAVFAPFVMGFGALTMAVWTMIILGGLVAIFAGYEGFFARPQTK